LWASNGANKNLSYEQVQNLMKSRLKGRGETITEEEIKDAVQDSKLEMEGLLNVDPQLIAIEETAANAYYNKRNIPPIGSIPTERPAGTWRWIFGNVNGIATSRVRNFKIGRLKAIKDKYNANGIGMVEVGLDMRELRAHQTLPALLEMEENSKSSVSHNRHDPKSGKKQQGGCAIIAWGEVCQYVKISKGCNDHRELGRICSIVLQARGDHRTRLVVAYNVGKPKTKWLGSVYQQLLRYNQNNDIREAPRTLISHFTALSRHLFFPHRSISLPPNPKLKKIYRRPPASVLPPPTTTSSMRSHPLI
jgi:hypothetical protein